MKIIKQGLLILLIVCNLLILTACGEKEQFKTITFMNGDEKYYAYKFSGKGEISMPENPTLEGQKFVGWFLDYDCTLIMDKNEFKYEALDADIQVFAKFISNEDAEKKFNITLDFNGGEDETWEDEDNVLEVKYYGSYKLPIPVKDNMLFTGWFDSNEVNYSLIEKKVHHIQDNLNLVARFIPDTEIELEAGLYVEDTTIKTASWEKLVNSNAITVEGKTIVSSKKGELNGNLIISKEIEVIGKEAFYSCNGLTEVDFEKESNIQVLERNAFDNCGSLEQVRIPSTITTMGEKAFYKCVSLENVNFDNECNVKVLEKEIFRFCNNLEEIYIPESVEIINSGAFMMCTELEFIYFSSNSKVHTIRDKAFAFCESLTELYLPEGVTVLADYLFDSCIKLVGLQCMGELVEIGSYTFNHCEALTAVRISNTVTKIGKYAFNFCTALKSVEFESPENWYAVNSYLNETGLAVDFTDTKVNVENLKVTYLDMYLKQIKIR